MSRDGSSRHGNLLDARSERPGMSCRESKRTFDLRHDQAAEKQPGRSRGCDRGHAAGVKTAGVPAWNTSGRLLPGQRPHFSAAKTSPAWRGACQSQRPARRASPIGDRRPTTISPISLPASASSACTAASIVAFRSSGCFQSVFAAGFPGGFQSTCRRSPSVGSLSPALFASFLAVWSCPALADSVRTCDRIEASGRIVFELLPIASPRRHVRSPHRPESVESHGRSPTRRGPRRPAADSQPHGTDGWETATRRRPNPAAQTASFGVAFTAPWPRRGVAATSSASDRPSGAPRSPATEVGVRFQGAPNA